MAVGELGKKIFKFHASFTPNEQWWIQDGAFQMSPPPPSCRGASHTDTSD